MLKRSPEANALWESVYAEPVESHSGTYGRVIERARPQVMRLALIYALMDGSSVIERVHLEAGLAVWDYCKASAKAIFSRFNSQIHSTIHEPEALPLAARLLEVIKRTSGIKRSELTRAFRSEDADSIQGALDWLEENGKAHSQVEEGKGRFAECWFVGGKEGRKEACPMFLRSFPMFHPSFPMSKPLGRKEVSKGEGEEAQDPSTLTSFLPSHAPHASRIDSACDSNRGQGQTNGRVCIVC